MTEKTEIENRIEHQRRWAERIEALKLRKDSPMTERAFCVKHGICPMQFNRHKKLKVLARKEALDRVHSAFNLENI